jgi:hypothetical protein
VYNSIEFHTLLEYLNRKDIKTYNKEELQLFSELFLKSGYNIELNTLIKK